MAKENPKDPAPLVAAGDLSINEGDALGALTYYQRALTLDPGRIDLLEKVQQLLQSGSRPDRGMDPFRPPGRPGMPHVPDPLEGLYPPGYGNDPFNPGRRR